MEAIGHLTGDITHDFNNILTRIMGYFVIAQKWAERLQGSKLERYLKCAQHSGERARDLIQQMLTFSRGQRGEPRPVGLDAVITESLALLPSTVEIRTKREVPLSAAFLDPLHVERC